MNGIEEIKTEKRNRTSDRREDSEETNETTQLDDNTNKEMRDSDQLGSDLEGTNRLVHYSFVCTQQFSVSLKVVRLLP